MSFLHRNPIYVYLKNYLALYVERLGYGFGTILVTSVGISYFASQICMNSTRDTFIVSKKKLTKYVHISSIISSYLKIQNNAQVFMRNPCFLRVGLNVI